MATADTDVNGKPDKMPALYQHCVETYAAMVERSEEQEIDGIQVQVYEGFLTTLIRHGLSLPTPYYSFVTKALQRMDCIRQVRRGGGSTPSVWALVQEPTEDLFINAKADYIQKPNLDRRLDGIEQMLRDLNTRLLELEKFQKRVGG